MNKLNLGIITGLLIFFPISCSMMKDSKAAEPAVAKFHEQFNAKEFKTIYEQSGDQLKAAATEEEMMDLLDAIYRKLGTYKSSRQTSGRVDTGPMSSMVNVVYDTEFSDGKGSEQFLISVSGDTVKLEGYHINSMDLITK